MGGGKGLDEGVKPRLVAELAKVPTAFSLLCYVDDVAAGLANCFHGFSTFQCRPLVNVHDLVVIPPFRGLGLSQRLLEKVQETAIGKGGCKITLEVLESNTVARRAYEKFGFRAYALEGVMGKALFWEKPL